MRNNTLIFEDQLSVVDRKLQASIQSINPKYVTEVQLFDDKFQLHDINYPYAIGWIGKLNAGDYTGFVFFDCQDPVDHVQLRSSQCYQSWGYTPSLLLQSLKEKLDAINQRARDLTDPFKRLDYLLENYDWYYYMSDSFSVFSSGDAWHKRTVKAYFLACSYNEEKAKEIWIEHAPSEIVPPTIKG